MVSRTMRIACGAWRASRTGCTFSTRTRMRCASSAQAWSSKRRHLGGCGCVCVGVGVRVCRSRASERAKTFWQR
eukprot:8998870-Alexandrium_andersonii.AAC.1